MFSQVLGVHPRALWSPWRQEWVSHCVSSHWDTEGLRPATSFGLELTRSPASNRWWLLVRFFWRTTGVTENTSLLFESRGAVLSCGCGVTCPFNMLQIKCALTFTRFWACGDWECSGRRWATNKPGGSGEKDWGVGCQKHPLCPFHNVLFCTTRSWQAGQNHWTK